MTPKTYADVLEEALACDERLVEVERRGDRAIVRLADPEKRNVLSERGSCAQLLAAAERWPGARGPLDRPRGEWTGVLDGGDLRMMRERHRRGSRRTTRRARPCRGSGTATSSAPWSA